MKQLTKEQHEAILKFVTKTYLDGIKWEKYQNREEDSATSFDLVVQHFNEQFHPDSCADGEKCENKGNI